MQLFPTTSQEAFTRKGVTILTDLMNRAVKDHGRCTLGLSGGSTPGAIYTAVGKEDIDWEKVWLFLVDERYCDPESDDSNQKMVRSTLLKSATIPKGQIIFPDTLLPLDACIADYESRLFDISTFDILTLGLGPDGHIASLFPPLSQDVVDTDRRVLHTQTEDFAVHDRITLSPTAIQSAKEHVFFVKGEEKQDVLQEMERSSEGVEKWPAKMIDGGQAIIW